MNAFRVTFANGDTITTNMNADLAGAHAYYVGRVFNLGRGEHDLLSRAVAVEQV